MFCGSRGFIGGSLQWGDVSMHVGVFLWIVGENRTVSGPPRLGWSRWEVGLSAATWSPRPKGETPPFWEGQRGD